MNKKLKVLSSGLLLSGFISLGIGLWFVIYSSDESHYEFTELLSDIPEDRVLEFNSPYYRIDVENNTTFVYYKNLDLANETYLKFRILFKTKDVFSVANPIDYKILAKVVGKPYVEKIVFFIEGRGVDYSVVDENSLDSLIELLKGENVIELEQKELGLFKKEDLRFEDDTIHIPFGLTYYEDEGFFTIPTSYDITLVPFVVGKDGTVYHVEKAEKLFTVNPAYTKLQAEANRIIIKNAQIQARNNDLTLGLTFIVVAGIPLVITTQILIMNRRKNYLTNFEQYFRNYGNKITNIENDVRDLHSRYTGYYKKSND